MRLLHTSDWHVGKLLRGQSRAGEHRAVLAEIVDLARAEHVDVALVVGDLFENAAPSPESEEIVFRALLDLAATGATVAVVAGNHDNARRLRALEPVFGQGRILLVSEARKPDEGGVVRVETRDGTGATLAMLPFVSHRWAVRAAELMGLGPDERAGQYSALVRELLDVLRSGFDPATVNIVVAHLMVGGGVMGGGERSAHTVFEYAVPASAFPIDAQYVALGHLHRAQSLPAGCPVRYCGSPLQLDFGESEDRKSITIVDVEPGRPASTREVQLRAGRSLRTLRGSLEQLEAQREQVGDEFLRIFVQEQRRAGIGDEVRSWFPDAVDVVVEPPDGGSAERSSPVHSRRGRAPAELFADFLAERSVDDERVLRLFEQLLDEVDAH